MSYLIVFSVVIKYVYISGVLCICIYQVSYVYVHIGCLCIRCLIVHEKCSVVPAFIQSQRKSLLYNIERALVTQVSVAFAFSNKEQRGLGDGSHEWMFEYSLAFRRCGACAAQTCIGHEISCGKQRTIATGQDTLTADDRGPAHG